MAFLKTLVVAKLLNKFPACYTSRKSVNVFAIICHWALLWTSSMHYTPTNPSPIFMAFSHLGLLPPCRLYHWGFPTKISRGFSFPTFVLYVLSNSPRFNHPTNIKWSIQVTKFLIMIVSQFTCSFIFIKPNILNVNSFSGTFNLSSIRLTRQVSHTKQEHFSSRNVTFGYGLEQWYSTFFVRVPPDIISLQLCTPKIVGV
jgi:hypothetical protein